MKCVKQMKNRKSQQRKGKHEEPKAMKNTQGIYIMAYNFK